MVAIKDVMKSMVQTIGTDNSVAEAAKKMSINKVSCLVVTEDMEIKGIITERDIVYKLIAMERDPHSTDVSEIMTSEVKTIDQSEDLNTAAELMKIGRFKQLPVVYSGSLAGIVTMSDLIKYEH